MASSIDYLECEQCGGIAYNELNCRTLEEWCKCNRCGCGFDYVLKRDKKGEVIFDRKKRPKYRFIKSKGHGVIYLCFKNGCGVFYHLDKALSRKNRKNFFLDIETNPEIDKEKSYLTKWNKKLKKVVAVYGEIPPAFEDWDKRSSEDIDKEQETL